MVDLFEPPPGTRAQHQRVHAPWIERQGAVQRLDRDGRSVERIRGIGLDQEQVDIVRRGGDGLAGVVERTSRVPAHQPRLCRLTEQGGAGAVAGWAAAGERFQQVGADARMAECDLGKRLALRRAVAAALALPAFRERAGARGVFREQGEAAFVGFPLGDAGREGGHRQRDLRHFPGLGTRRPDHDRRRDRDDQSACTQHEESRIHAVECIGGTGRAANRLHPRRCRPDHVFVDGAERA